MSRVCLNARVGLVWILLGVLLVGCSSQPETPVDWAASEQAASTRFPTPSAEVLRVSDILPDSSRLRVTVPSLQLLKHSPDSPAQVFLILADGRGGYAYVFYPANRAGDTTDNFDLSEFPLELSLSQHTTAVSLWMLAVHNTRYAAAEKFGVDALVSSLAIGFDTWLSGGDPQDDPLAAVVSASEGALYEWFAGVEVLGQAVTTFYRETNWNTGLNSIYSPDEGLNAIYLVSHVNVEDQAEPTGTPTVSASERPGYVLRLNETFSGGTSAYNWYQGQDETYINQLVNGAYEIRLTLIQQRDFGLSWGSLQGMRFDNSVIEAEVRLVEDDVAEGRYGIWFNYQDDYNFIYFGISNQGEYRVAVMQSEANRIEIQAWTPHPAILPGAATNTLTVESGADGLFALGVNGERLLTFQDTTFSGGSIAFFCYAKSTPATCRLERLRIWEPISS